MLALIAVALCKPNVGVTLRANVPFLIWVGYLVIHFTFLSTDIHRAAISYKGAWLQAALFTLLGMGSGLVFARLRCASLILGAGILFSIPLLIHLVQLTYVVLHTGSIPWGYTGLFPTHGELGYTALFAVSFLLTDLLFFATASARTFVVVLLLAAGLASPILAQGRGGTIFALISCLTVLVCGAYAKRQSPITHGRILATGGLTIVLGAVGIYFAIQADPARWLKAQDRVAMGLVGDPMQVICHGANVIRNALVEAGKTITPETEESLKGLEGDGGRMVVLRAGMRLLKDHPLGIDGSKEAYQIARSQVCASPAIAISSAHNGWIDTALAIGIPGAVLYLLMLLNYARLGWRGMGGRFESRPYAVLLTALSVVWMLRPVLDTAQRDHMLQMQTYTFGLLLALMLGIEQMREGSIASHQRQA